eukprot:snap_masked-scaffold_11-processed-gene-10.21-mRNA-1 protein AED:0.41 eAED:0.41 QI:0/-1/0/1/-1/1/1/0/2083
MIFFLQKVCVLLFLCCSTSLVNGEKLARASRQTSSSSAYRFTCPTNSPTSAPTFNPTGAPTAVPSGSPSQGPMIFPTSAPTSSPSLQPSTSPSPHPTKSPTSSPTRSPTLTPNISPTSSPTVEPTSSPTHSPTDSPTYSPTHTPTYSPTYSPTNSPTFSPTFSPTAYPTYSPTFRPTDRPTSQPIVSPTSSPTGHPTNSPSQNPTVSPTQLPSNSPTSAPSFSPTIPPSFSPSSHPTTSPSLTPNISPTSQPTFTPSSQPSYSPTLEQTFTPTYQPTVSPSYAPSVSPSHSPSASPTNSPTMEPTRSPVTFPTESPTVSPTKAPSLSHNISLTAAIVDTHSSFALIFSERVNFDNTTFPCGSVFQYPIIESFICTLRRDANFKLEVVFVDVELDAVDLLEQNGEGSNITIVGLVFSSPKGEPVGLLESSTLVFPPEPVGSTINDKLLSITFDRDISLIGLSTQFFCRNLFSLVLCDHPGPFDLMEEDYACSAHVFEGNSLFIEFQRIVPFRAELEYVFVPSRSSSLKGGRGIGTILKEMAIVSTLTSTNFSYRVTTPFDLFPCHNSINILLEQTSNISVLVEVEYSFWVVGSGMDAVKIFRPGSIRTNFEELVILSPSFEAFIQGNNVIFLSMDAVVKDKYHGEVLYQFSEDFQYYQSDTQIQAVFRNGDEINVLSSDEVKLIIDVAPISTLCGIQGIDNSSTNLFQYSCAPENQEEEESLAVPSEFTLKFPEGNTTLNCAVSLSESFNSTTGFSPINISLLIYSTIPPPVAKLQAEKITVDVNKEVRISAEASCDPSNLESDLCNVATGFTGDGELSSLLDDRGFREGVSFVWNCNNCEVGEVPVFNTTESPLSPLITNLEAHRSYSFSLEIIDDEGTVLSFASIQVETISGDSCELPIVELSALPERVNPVDFHVSAALQNLEDLEQVGFQWTIFTEVSSGGQGMELTTVDTSSTITTRQSLFVPSSTLPPGANYVLEVNVTNLCGSGTRAIASSQRRISVNSPPVGGIVEVTPIASESLLQEYSLETLLWVDDDSDALLEYSFHYSFLSTTQREQFIQDPSLEFSKSQTFPLVPFVRQNILIVYLPVPPEDHSLAVIAVATDSDGGVSSLLGLNAVLDVETNNTFLDSSGNLRNDIDASVVKEFLNGLSLSGRSREIPFASSVIGSQLNEINNSPSLTSSEIREISFESTKEILENVVDEGSIDVLFLNQVADGYDSLTRVAEEISDPLITSFIPETERLVTVLMNTIEEKSNNFKDPFSPGLLANSIREGVFGILSNSVNLIDRDDSVSSSNLTTTRILYQTASSCEVALSSETIIRQLSNLSNAVVPNGAPAYSVNTNNFEFFSARERDREIGGENRVSGFVFSNGENSVTFGTGLNANGERVFGSTSQDVNVYAVNWNRNIRCDRGLTPPIEDICLPNITFSGPVGDDPAFISNTLTVEILSRGSELNKIAVEGVNDAISLVLDKHDSSQTVSLPDTCADKSPCGILLEKETACGVYEKRINDWDSVGCEVVTSAKTSPGTVECRCSHLSNYASFYAFKKDLIQIGEPIVCESALAITRTTYAGNLYFLFGFCLIGWSFYDDKYDSQQVQKAAVARITLIRVLQRHQKRKLFRNFENRLNFMDSEGQRTSSTIIIDQPPKNQTKALFFNFLKALRYEHSLFSIGKFDPHYSKLQRTAVFLTVILGNFAVSALFFNLTVKGDDLPVWFILIVGLVCAFCIAVPIKIFMKVLFRTTENFIGSVNDICANSTKILTRLEEGDGRLLPSDNQLIDNYRQLLWASTRLNASQTSLSSSPVTTALSPVSSVEPVEGSVEVRIEHCLEWQPPDEDIVTAEYVVELQEQVYEATVMAREVWDRSISEVQSLVVVSPVLAEKSGKFDSEMGQSDIPVAFYTLEWQRIIASESQGRSLVKRIAAVISDTASPKARSRRSRLRENMLYFNWVLLAMIVGSLSFLSAYFVLSRFQDIAEEGAYTYQNISLIREKENEEFYSWLYASLAGIALSYFVAEPISLFFRFFLAPLYIIKLGNDEFLKLPDESADRSSSRTIKAMTSLRENGSFSSKATSAMFDYLADIIENLI